ncbi:MAG: LL-diaminopimelate aminotransferase [Candidatus Limisoma sp.]|nr:LL-diaminopimelate aminotransferase [Bacteroidales bacterium]MDY5893675.1 LL-diaminopimelate aminotransferase [Candidatus Limisoma sp.]
MAFINDNFLKLPGSYLFSEIARRVEAFKASHPGVKLIRLGIGDVTRPLPPACIEAMHKAVDEMASADTFRGYGPEQGYEFLRRAIVENDYAGLDIDASEVFVSDGAKSDTGNFGDILAQANTIGVTDPIYPVYIDSNVMGGRAGTLAADGHWSDVCYLPCTADNGFAPQIPDRRLDVVYLCYPNNPMGTTLTRSQLAEWVDYALANDTLLLFDAAYEAFITEPDVPHSIYEIEGARRCAVEFRSYSKTAGFTGVRCGFTVVPKDLTVKAADGSRVALNAVWNRRQCTKFNGTSYITQRAAEAIYTPEGKAQVRATIDYYLRNASTMLSGLRAVGLEAYGGVNSPYIWLKTPAGVTSWEFFDKLLNEANVVGTPGAGFGPAGEGYLRLTAFGTYEDCLEAMDRIAKNIKK